MTDMRRTTVTTYDPDQDPFLAMRRENERLRTMIDNLSNHERWNQLEAELARLRDLLREAEGDPYANLTVSLNERIRAALHLDQERAS